MKDCNQIYLSGVISREPELRESAKALRGTFTVSVKRKAPAKGMDFLPVVVWNETARNLCALPKDAHVSIEGVLRRSSYVGTDGLKHYSMDIIADKVIRDDMPAQIGLPQDVMQGDE